MVYHHHHHHHHLLLLLPIRADAVYLGLKNFNARSRAENFGIKELEELVPLAHHYGMQVGR